VSFVTIDSITTQHLQLLKTLSKQIVWLKAGDIKLTDSALSVIGSLPALTRLYLNKTNITDKGLLYLKNLSQLQYLNLSGTNVTTNGINNLARLKNLKQLFLYQTTISSEGLGLLKKTFTNTIIDTGGYKVDFLKDDTMKVNSQPVKN
jgi:Leucine-rich repeat (LRR) protein